MFLNVLSPRVSPHLSVCLCWGGCPQVSASRARRASLRRHTWGGGSRDGPPGAAQGPSLEGTPQVVPLGGVGQGSAACFPPSPCPSEDLDRWREQHSDRMQLRPQGSGREGPCVPSLCGCGHVSPVLGPGGLISNLEGLNEVPMEAFQEPRRTQSQHGATWSWGWGVSLLTVRLSSLTRSLQTAGVCVSQGSPLSHVLAHQLLPWTKMSHGPHRRCSGLEGGARRPRPLSVSRFP